MDRIITGNVWTQLRALIKSNDRKVAAIAYVSKGTPLSFGDGDILVCDASDAAIKSGETDAVTLRRFRQNGAGIFSCENLHAKTLVSGSLVIVGSANLSASSENRLLEACLITTRSQIRSQARVFIHETMKVAKPVDEAFLDHILQLPVTRRGRRVFGSTRPKIKQFGKRYWVVNTRPMDDYPASEEKYLEKGEEEARSLLDDSNAEINWIRWTGKSRFRQLAKRGDTVVEITIYKRKASVSYPRAILVSQHHKKWARFYLAEPDTEMSWSKFERELKKVGLTKIKKASVRELNQRHVLLMESIWQSGER